MDTTSACEDSQVDRAICASIPTNLRHRLRGGARPRLRRPSASAASSSRPTAARPGTTSVPRRQDRRRRPVDRPEEPRRDLRGALGGVPHAVVDVERRPGQRPVQVHRRRRHLDRDHQEPRPADRPVGQGRRVGVGRRQQPRLRASSRTKPAAVCIVSDDAGATWTKINDDRNLRQRAFYYTRIYADPKDKDTVYVLNVQFFKSTDGGKTFPTQHPRAARRQPRPVDRADRQQAHGPGQRRRRQRLVNGGQTWTDQDFPTGQFYNVFTTKHVPYHICGAQQDNSTACVGSQAQAGAGEGSLPPIFYAVGGGESGYIAPDPTDTNVFYAGSYGGYLSRLDRETGQQRASTSTRTTRWATRRSTSRSASSGRSRSCSRRSTRRCSTPRRSTCGAPPTAARAGRRISPNLTRSDPKTMQASGGPITKDQTGVETYAVVFTIAPSRQDVNTIWTGSDDGWVHVTRDGGKNWEQGHAARSAGVRAHQPDRSVAAPERRRLPRRQPLPAGRPRSRTSTRPPTSARPGRRSSTAFPTDDFPRVDSRRPEAPRPALPRHRARHLRLVQRRRHRGSRCG